MNVAVRALFVAGLLVAVTACSSGDSDDIPGATLSTAITTTAAPATTAATTTVPATTTSPAGELTPELEAEIIATYQQGSLALYEALSDPASADTTTLTEYWAPSLASGWIAMIAEWSAAGQRAEPGPRALHYQEPVRADLITPEQASLTTCNVSDVAVFDAVNGLYLDPGVTGSGTHRIEVRLVGDRWLIYSDEEVKHFGEQVGCDE